MVTTDEKGRFLVVWRSLNNFGSGHEIVGRLFYDSEPIFADGFESGDTQMWGAGSRLTRGRSSLP